MRRRASVTSVTLKAGPAHRCNTNTVAYIVDRGCALPCSAKYIKIIIKVMIIIIMIKNNEDDNNNIDDDNNNDAFQLMIS